MYGLGRVCYGYPDKCGHLGYIADLLIVPAVGAFVIYSMFTSCAYLCKVPLFHTGKKKT
jgi:hypothetical protein